MTVPTLTVNEALRYANHDYLNHLHLIQMNLDLERVEEAKKVIEQLSEHCKILSNVNRLKLPKTVEWFQTVNWRYPALQMQVTSHVLSPVNSEYDEAIVQYLEKTIIHVYDGLSPYEEQQLQMNIETNEKDCTITFHLKGKWQQSCFSTEQNILNVETIEETDSSWKFVIHIHEE
ncbi:sporulation protein [Lysinibacillus sp. 2017]|uniref:Spo0B domain-containing protein n=1 Tax=unclassified Lysinibacillus TaxID=2636778 RepID=UPI000D528368|nr:MULTISPECIES: Spo0B domain-containing protein [unclassified Lysinibacillus]AWE08168.1 sporulation protein [Lysinibacillus sp. 2017]TGN36328.1 sporulation protein [Lysinibacillus sp. S2017]